MPKNNFENKIKKLARRAAKSFYSSDYEIELRNRDFNIPINETPPHPVDHEPNVSIGDLVANFDYDDVSGEIERCGIVIDARWYRIEKSTRFSKKSGEWVSKYVCLPRAIVMWSDGRISSIFMNLLTKKDAG